MKLSEAIQLGAMWRPQIYGPFYGECGTCAMGAALDAVGQLVLASEKVRNVTATNKRRVRRVWPWLTWRLDMKRCPWCSRWCSFEDVYEVIAHLNDDDHLSRTRIAELIAKIETQAIEQLEPNPTPEARAKLADLESHLKLKEVARSGRRGRQKDSSKNGKELIPV